MRDDPTPAASWIDDERRSEGIRRELGRIARRAVARPFRTIGITLLVAGALVGRRGIGGHGYKSRIVFRVTEGDVAQDLAPQPNKNIRAFVHDEAFSNRKLTTVMRKFNISPQSLERDPASAIESFREDIAIQVWRNYFLGGREDGGEPRSARLSITYTDRDPQRAFDLVSALGKLVVDTAKEGRLAVAEAALQSEQLEAVASREELLRRRIDMSRLEIELERRPRPETPLELADARGAVQRLEESLELRARRRIALELSAEAERRELGLEFKLVDPGRAERPVDARLVGLLLYGLLVIALILPAVAIGVAVSDDRIDGIADLHRIGFATVGHVGPFPGDDTATLEDREKVTGRP